MTRFTCPKCGSTEAFDWPAATRFRYGAVWVLYHDVEITETGWCADKWSTYDLHDASTVICAECGYEGEMSEFEEEA